ncbi:MAG: sigma 54-interacting transcriptional regulator [Desulfovibrionales bacterium]
MEISIRNLKLKVLLAISQSMDKALHLEQALPDILQVLSETMSMKRATVTVIDPETGQLTIMASHGLTPEEMQRGVYRMDEGVTGRIFQTSTPYYIPDIRKEPLFLNKTGSRTVEKDKISFLGVPILLHGKTIGVLNVDRLFEDNVSVEEDIDFLQIVATLIAQFISLNEQVRKALADLKRENISLKQQLSRNIRKLYIVGKSQAMLDVQRQIEKVAPTRATVLLLGESGTGKTLIARIIHELSDRKSFPFIKVNCASIPENLLESELFGYERGAFTGASGSKAGRFEDADKGSIFLDEIGELPLGLQAKLLRVLQDREFERLGSNETKKVDVRIIAATNKNLEELTEQGKFRPDLFYRLNVFPINAPPLRDRKEDIQSLLIPFLEKVSQEYNRKLYFTPEALEGLKFYNWPGNVREMENLVERLVIMAEGRRIDASLIRPYLALERREYPSPGALSGAKNPSLQEIEKNEVIAALRRNSWIQQKSARDLGITLRQLGYRIKKYSLETLVAEQRALCRAKKKV